MSDLAEVEAKFEADDDAQQRLLTLQGFGDFRLVERDSKLQNDVYYDTAAGHLREAGATLRIRRRSSGAQMTFKGERQTAGDSHVVSRLEDEVDLDAASIAGLDDETPLMLPIEPRPLERARALSANEALTPMARLMTHRSVLLFEDGAGNQVEISIDRCEATRLMDGRAVTFSEVELELKQGEADALLEAAEALERAVGGLKPSTKTKLERTLK